MTAWGKRERAGEIRAPGAQAPKNFNPAATVAPGYWFWRLSCECMPSGMTPPGERIGKVIL